jgi:hypothetical protein
MPAGVGYAFDGKGKIEFQANNQSINGSGSYLYHLNLRLPPSAHCTFTETADSKVTAKGTVGPVLGVMGATLKFAFAWRLIGHGHTDNCSDKVREAMEKMKQLFGPPPLPPEESTGRLEMTLRDGEEESWIPLLQAATTFSTSSVKLRTPCPGWNSRKSLGPELKAEPIDPRTVAPDEAPPIDNLEFTSEELTTKVHKDPSKVRVFGFTEVPRPTGNEVKVKGSSFAPNIKSYQECIAVTEIDITFPTIKMWVASDISVNADCNYVATQHERVHWREALDYMRRVMADAQQIANTTPGPNNAEPHAVATGVEAKQNEIRLKLQQSFYDHYKEWEEQVAALDAGEDKRLKEYAEQKIQNPCGPFLPTAK